MFYEVDGSDPQAPWTTGSGTFQQLMFELVGGANIAADLEGWGQLSLEAIVVRDPQVIIFGAGPFVPTTVESLMARPGWERISAVEQGRVYPIDTDLVDVPGPRLVEGLELLARLLHPEAFSD
jgi:iron complex transport system substrate-binding protein